VFSVFVLIAFLDVSLRGSSKTPKKHLSKKSPKILKKAPTQLRGRAHLIAAWSATCGRWVWRALPH
jgi:hypothetical protein